MANSLIAPPTVSVYTRHTAKCPYRKNRFSRQCMCPKWLEIHGDGDRRRCSAKTRDGRTADEYAAAEQARLRGTALPASPAVPLTVAEGLDKWVKNFKVPWSHSTAEKYKFFAAKVTRWAAESQIKFLKDVTPESLETWRGEWGLGAQLPPDSLHKEGKPRRKDDQMGPTSQKQFQGYLVRFCRWAHARGHFPTNPAALLGRIEVSSARTMPLSLEQFDQLIAAAEGYDSLRRRDSDRFGAELKAIFLVQFWVGLRILDVLKLPRNALVGNTLTLKTQKTGDHKVAKVPLHVAAALRAIPKRLGTHKDYFFWSRNCSTQSLEKNWVHRINILRKQLAFVDEDGQPMIFHSHMLRDTFAVQRILAGMPVEQVSRLLTHKSIATTQRYYLRWIKEMETQLEDSHVSAMKRMGAEF